MNRLRRTGTGGSLEVEVVSIEARHVTLLRNAFHGTPWDRGPEFFEGLVGAHQAGSRHVWVGLANGCPVAFGSLVWQSTYPPFREQRIPEIHDLNVSPAFRRNGIASRIMDTAEQAAVERSNRVGIGVGLHSGYFAAQRLYVRRGYVPDGNGVFFAGRFPQEGEQVVLDDSLTLYLIKQLTC